MELGSGVGQARGHLVDFLDQALFQRAFLGQKADGLRKAEHQQEGKGDGQHTADHQH